MSNLQSLLLYGNTLAGSIPSSLGSLGSLEDLWLHENALTGPIPETMGQLTNVRALLLHENALTGPIPQSLGQMTQLEELWVFGNELNGRIPGTLGRLANLRELWLYDNTLEGPIPSALGRLSNLRSLMLHENKLTGGLPGSLAQLARLEWLQVNENDLDGLLPDSLGHLAALEYLYLQDNAFTGELPASLVNLTALKELFFGGQEACAPVDAAFQAWLSSLDAVRGADCGGAILTFAAHMEDLRYAAGSRIADLVLPEAEGGTPPYHYSLHPDLPIGLQFDAATRTLHGAPQDTVASVAYTYAAVDGAGNSGHLSFKLTVEASADELLVLHGNFPNPFRGSTHVELTLGENARVGVEVFDLLGRRVLRQAPRLVEAGLHRKLPLEGLDAAPGLYLYRLDVAIGREKLVRTGRMTVVR